MYHCLQSSLWWLFVRDTLYGTFDWCANLSWRAKTWSSVYSMGQHRNVDEPSVLRSPVLCIHAINYHNIVSQKISLKCSSLHRPQRTILFYTSWQNASSLYFTWIVNITTWVQHTVYCYASSENHSDFNVWESWIRINRTESYFSIQTIIIQS